MASAAAGNGDASAGTGNGDVSAGTGKRGASPSRVSSSGRVSVAMYAPGSIALLRGRTPERIGGVEVQQAILARHLPRHVDLTLIAEPMPDGSLPPGQSRLGAVQIVTMDDRHWAGKGAVGRTTGLARAIREAVAQARCDVVVQRIANVATLHFARAARASGSRFVYHWASDHDGRLRDLHVPFGWLGRWGFAWGKRRADAQVVMTREQLAMAQRTARRAVALHVLPDLIDDAVAWRDAGGDAVLWVGTIRPEYKRPERFLDLARSLPQRRFVMAGRVQGPAEFQRWFHDTLAALPNVEHLGQVTRDRLPDVYASARMLVNTSDVEGFNNTFLEACASGLPVVSLTHDPNGILSEGRAGLCLRGQTQRLAGAVESLFEDAAWLRHREGCRRVAALHSAPALSGQYAHILGQVALGAA